jgi:RNA polymerase sigma-54 factor
MSLLVLSNAELQEKINAELSTNPALELLEERVCPTCHRPLVGKRQCPVCSLGNETTQEAIVFLSPRESIRPRSKRSQDDLLMDNEPVAPEDLSLNVLRQLAADLDPEDRKLAVYILSSLDEDGFLQDQPAIIARTNRVTLQRVQKVLDLISQVDPTGLGSIGPREALLAQLKQFDDRLPRVALANRIIETSFRDLGNRNFETIADKLDVKVHKIRQAVIFIQDSLNPYPARAYWGSGRHPQAPDPNVYHTPDIKVTTNPIVPDGALLAEIFTPYAGWLRVNPLFRKAMAKAEEEQSEAWSKQLERATLFVKCSRAVAHKSIELPDGRIIPLSRFFDRSLSVRDRIKEIVRNESKPLTDDEISVMLKNEGIKVARRTVAKYRSIEGILSARLRRRSPKPAMSRV